jgi:excisionase family DNA binding protein
MRHEHTTRDMLSTGQVGQALGVSINTVKSWVRTGKIAGFRLPSGHFRIPRGELERLLRGAPEEAGRSGDRWDEYQRWQQGQPADELDPDGVLAWIDSVLRLARSRGAIPEESLEEKAEGIRRMHRALARIGR